MTLNPQREMVLLQDALLAWRMALMRRGAIATDTDWRDAELRHRQVAMNVWCELVYRQHGGHATHI